MYPFRFPLSVISCSGVCLLTDVEKQNTGFFCDNYGNKKFVNFEKMINGEASNFICQKEKLTSDLESKVLKLNTERKD